jgi:hypothetical protein
VIVISCDSTDTLILNVQVGEDVALHVVLPYFLNDFCKVCLSIKAGVDGTFNAISYPKTCMRTVLGTTHFHLIVHEEFKRKPLYAYNKTTWTIKTVVSIAVNAYLTLTTSRSTNYHPCPFLRVHQTDRVWEY